MKTASAARTPQVFAFLFCSVDGFVEDAHRGLGWSTGEPEVFTWHRRRTRQTPHIGGMLLGRNTYDHFAEYWPSAEAFRTQPEIAAFMETTPKTVVTNRPASLASWQGARAAEERDLTALVEQLRTEQEADSGGEIAVFGSSTLAAQLLERGLLDELRILISPVALGRGTRLFQGLESHVHLQAGPTTTFPSGAVLVTYAPENAGTA